MNRRALLLAGLAALTLPPAAAQAAGQGDPVIATWGENSGSLPPQHAWHYQVRIHASGRLEVDYCKGYAETAPGCAAVSRALSQTGSRALAAELEPFLPALRDNPPRSLAPGEHPIGGGSVSGWVLVGQSRVTLPAFPAPSDADLVKSVLAVLRKHTPASLIRKAARRARQP